MEGRQYDWLMRDLQGGLDISQLLLMAYLRKWWAEGPEQVRGSAESGIYVAMELFGSTDCFPDSCLCCYESVYVREMTQN